MKTPTSKKQGTHLYPLLKTFHDERLWGASHECREMLSIKYLHSGYCVAGTVPSNTSYYFCPYFMH